MNPKKYDKIIIGAGIYGLYSALRCAINGQHIIVLECDNSAFKRATFINQARVHQGYHYPRSISTALKTAGYFDKFNKDFGFCINNDFEQIYATSSRYSWSNGEQFKRFCKAVNIPCEEVHVSKYFKDGMCDGAFKTREFTYDAMILKEYLLDQLKQFGNAVEMVFNTRIISIEKCPNSFCVITDDNKSYEAGFVLNATYAGMNQILEMAGFENLGIKYELCEIILCNVEDKLKNTGITVMDGPFFSIMPFGKTGFHSLTSVTFTPHMTCYDKIPSFSCQNDSAGYCSKKWLGNCNDCPARPNTAFPYMSNLAKKYMLDDFGFEYEKSLFSMKPILASSEIDDSRPTIIRTYSHNPTFVGVLSGKINTVYDLDEVLDEE